MTELTTIAEIVADAALAPSAHNTQPWSPRVIGDGQAVELRVARGRTLPSSDPTGRDTLLGLGAWLEAFEVGADARGVELDIELLPALSDPKVIVRARSDEPVLRIHLSDRADTAPGGAAAPHPDGELRLLTARATVRGGLAPATGLVLELAQTLPEWLRVVPVDADDLRHFSALGSADTLRDPAVARELTHWLRLHPSHPKYDIDGLNDKVLGVPRVAARLAAAFTRRRRLRGAAVRIATPVGDLARRLLLEVPVSAAGEDPPAVATAFALVADTKLLGLGSGAEATRVLDSPLGLPAGRMLEAGRALMSAWLHAARRGAAFSPASEVLDSSLAQGELRYRLGLSRRDVPLFVTRVGIPRDPNPPRSPRR